MATDDDDDGVLSGGFDALYDQSAALYARVPPSAQHAYATASYWRDRYEVEQRNGAKEYDWCVRRVAQL